MTLPSMKSIVETLADKLRLTRRLTTPRRSKTMLDCLQFLPQWQPRAIDITRIGDF